MLKLFLTVAVYKLCTMPLNLRAISFAIAAQRLSPQVEAIKAAHPNDWMTSSKLTTQFYKQHGLNPASGCLLVLLDIFFFLAALCFGSPRTFLSGSGFFWVADLARYDGLIPLAWAGARYGQEIILQKMIWRNRDVSQVTVGYFVAGIVIWGAAWFFQWPAYVFAFWILMHFFYVIIAVVTVLTTKVPKPAPASPPGAPSPPSASPSPSPTTHRSPLAPSPPAIQPSPPLQPSPQSPYPGPGSPVGTSPAVPLAASPVGPCAAQNPAGQAGLSPTPAAKPFDLAGEIAKASPGGTIRIDPPGQEVQGPVVIAKPIIIEGQSGTIWANHGPVVSIESDGVVLRNVGIEITDNTAPLSGAAATALVVKNGLRPTFDHVSIRGDAEGVGGEEGVWRYPRAIVLGLVEAGRPHEFRLRLAVPVRCRLVADIAGLAFQPPEICRPDEVTLKLDSLPAGTRLRGHISLQGPTLNRTIFVTASISASASGAASGSDKVVYQPDDWDNVRRGPPPPPKPPPVQPAPVARSRSAAASAGHPLPAGTPVHVPTPAPHAPLGPMPASSAAPVPPTTVATSRAATAPARVPAPATSPSGAEPPHSPRSRQNLKDSVFGGAAETRKAPTQEGTIPTTPEPAPPLDQPEKTELPEPPKRRKVMRGGGMGVFGDSHDNKDK